MAKRTHVVFTTATTTRPALTGATVHRERITYGVYIDLDALEQLAVKVSKNKSRKGRDGPVNIEIHSIEPV